MDKTPLADPRIGLVDGSHGSNSRDFQVVLDANANVQLDQLVAVRNELPDGSKVTHYGIVTELRSRFEGADLPSDTARVVDRVMPAEHVRLAEVRGAARRPRALRGAERGFRGHARRRPGPARSPSSRTR